MFEDVRTDETKVMLTLFRTSCVRFGACLSHRKLKKVHCLLLLACVLFSGVFSILSYLQFVVRCSETEMINEIETICHLYHTKQITGNLCSKLCDENIFRYSQCGGNRRNKRVQLLDCYGCVEPEVISKVVLKSEFRADQWDKRVAVQFSESDSLQSKIDKTNAEITRRFHEHLQTDLSNHSNPLDLFISGDNFAKLAREMSGAKAGGENVVLRSILSLVSQNEVIAMKVFGPSSYIPKLYGTCGSSYLVEYTAPFGNFNYVIFQGKVTEIFKLEQRIPPWSERATIALGLLALLRQIQSDFRRPVHHCDSSAGNYGVSDKGNVVLLDTGSVAFDNIVPERRCEQDSDCGRSTCDGTCNMTSGWCAKEMRSTTLQVICRKVFLSPVERFGLLRSPPTEIADELAGLLHACAYPANPPRRLPPDNWSDMKMMKKLEVVLNKSLTL